MLIAVSAFCLFQLANTVVVLKALSMIFFFLFLGYITERIVSKYTNLLTMKFPQSDGEQG